MKYYVVFFCNWPEHSNAIVRGVELTTVSPEDYVTPESDYVYIVLENKTDDEINALMLNYVTKIGAMSIVGSPVGRSLINISQVIIRDTAPNTRKIDPDAWNDIAKPAWQRLAHTSQFSSL